MSLKIVLFILSLCAINCYAANILGFFPAPSKSHLLIHMPIVEALVEKGHNVTVITTLPLDSHGKNYTHIKLNIDEDKTFSPADLVKSTTEAPTGIIAKIKSNFKLLSFIVGFGNETLCVPELKEFLRDPGNKFDLLLLGGAFSEYQLGLADHFKCPSILVWINVPTGNVHSLIGNSAELAHVPTFGLKNLQPLGFVSRVKNIIIALFEKVIFLYAAYKQEQYYNYHFPSDKYRSFKEIQQNVSLVLAAHHFTQGPIRPNVPAMIEIGGIQIKPEPDPLPEKLQSFLDSATEHGVIYFNLGSNVATTMLNQENIDIIFKVFGSLKQNVIMKWEGNEIPIKTENILFDKWLPQTDILAHPNVKVFISHGGYGGIMEAKYRAVPIIGMPMFGDQFANVDRAVLEKWAISLNVKNLSEASLRHAVEEILSNPSYKERVQHYSNIYRDRISSPKVTAVFWIEYVLRHHGASHIQSPAVLMNWVEYYSLDVIVLLATFTILFIKFSIISVKFCWRKVFGRRKLPQKIKTK